MSTAVLAKNTANPATSIVFAVGIVSVVLMMVLPVPAMLLDGLLALSLTIAVGVFLTALFIEKPLDYSVFPAVVLIGTLFRLSLNVASTRLILLHGTEGQDAAGNVIQTFGLFVVGGNIIVGLVIFLILVVINFVVITKGAGRVSEVAARFTLDAMPGKQMAIDAEMNAGHINAEQAKTRRREIEREADFYGAMDGASKFVQGDAVAGLVITAINLVGGLVRGMMSGMDLARAGETFSILSVGEALVSQVPALLISTAAGIVVTRSATGEQLGNALARQLFHSRRAVALTAGVLTLFAVLPGMPMLPFMGLAGALAFVAYRGRQQEDAERAKEAAKPAPPAAKVEEVEASLPLDLLSLEVGYELIAMVDVSMGGTLLDRIVSLRRQLASELGVIVPPVRIRDNLELPPDTYRFLLLGAEIARGQMRSGRLLAMNAKGTMPEVDGDPAQDPVFKTPAKWVLPRDREVAEALGCTVVDHATVVATHLGELARTQADQLVGRTELQHLFDVFGKANPKLVEELVPGLLSLGDVLKVVRNLLREGVSIRDLRTLLEALADGAAQTKDPEQLTEMVRQRCARAITGVHKDAHGVINAIVLDAQVEEMFRRSLREIAQGSGGALDPEEVRHVGASLEAAAARQRSLGRTPLVVTSPDLRRYVRAFVERRQASIAVLSFREIEPNVTIQAVEHVSARPAAA